jgi:hypothetical protein
MRKIIGGVVAGVGFLAFCTCIGFGISAAVAAPAQPPTQNIRTGPNVADWCAAYVSNRVVYDWNQAPCPAGTYPVSVVSAPTVFTLTINGVTDNCSLSSSAADGDAIVCTGPAPTPTATATATATATSTATVTASPTATVTRNAQSITFTADSNTGTVGVTQPDFTAIASSTLPVTLSVDPASSMICSLTGSASGSDVVFSEAGNCVIDANQAGNATFAPAPQVAFTIVVSS